MSMSADFRPKGGDLEVRGANARPAEVLPSTSKVRRRVVRSASPASLAKQWRRIWSHRRLEPGGLIAWLYLVVAVPIALMTILALVIWWNLPGIHRVGDLRVDLLVEGVWHVGREAAANK